mgnify:CR=1 FL=1
MPFRPRARIDRARGLSVADWRSAPNREDPHTRRHGHATAPERASLEIADDVNSPAP